ncbi:MAG TPA: protein kinase [Kofleriaceae bacterium]|nr:protein kinase [Kofleriaceae bacterium]
MTARVADRLAEIASQPAARWQALLVEAFPDDPALVAQALLWLRADREALATAEAPPSLDERYVLGLRLDAGASAAVWQAFDRKLGRNVAIKLFHAQHDRATQSALAEARTACDVISDHVVRVLDVSSGDRPYIVMELVGEHDPRRGEQVPGASAAVLRPRDIDEAVRWVRDVARGVHDAHLRDVFHRDVKPQNVLITPVSRRARIGDFGLAVSAASGQDGGIELVKAGPTGPVRIAGTPEYMAPEQARGLPLALDPEHARDRAQLVAVDVWGLGALAYDLIGGRAPWASPPDDLEPWEYAASGAAPPPLAHKGERVSPRLRRVIAKAMAPEPGGRYTSAAELGDELSAYLALRPTSLDRSRLTRAVLFGLRNPQLSLTAGAAVVLAALTLAAYFAVVDLRGRARDLTAEVAAQEAANQQLSSRVAATRRDLDDTERRLKSRGDALATMQHALAEEETALREIIAARDQALHDADAATRALVDQLTVERSDRAAAELGRTMYEGFWAAARSEADAAAKDRDRAEHERDAARAERDQMQRERDAAHADRDRLEAQLDHAEDEVARLTAQAAATSVRIADLERKLLGMGATPAPGDAGTPAAPSDAGTPDH